LIENFDKPKTELLDLATTSPEVKSFSLSPAKPEVKKKKEITTAQISNFISSSINQTELKN